MDRQEIIKERIKLVKALNASGYTARKFTDSEFGLSFLERGNPKGAFGSMTCANSTDTWVVSLFGISELFSPMAITKILEDCLEDGRTFSIKVWS